MVQVIFSALRSRGEVFVLYFGTLYCFVPYPFHNISISARVLQCTLASVLDIFAGCCGCEPNLHSIENIYVKL